MSTAPPVRTVFITGGTHGNEANGVQLAKELARNPPPTKSFEVKVLLTNTAAIAKNVRYVEEDMNRCFLKKDLADTSRTSLEAKRARQLDAILGPKGSDSPAADLIIDLHNTTADTGVAMMISPKDELSHAIAAHLMAVDGSVRVCNWNPALSDYPMLPSVGRAGFTFEVGPCAWGCVDSASYQQSMRLLRAALSYIDAHNAAVSGAGAGAWLPRTIPVHSLVRAVDYPRSADGQLAGFIHPKLQGGDFKAPLRRGDPAFLGTDGETTIPWNPKRAAEDDAEEEEALYPFFINEAAYYEKGIAFSLARRTQRPVNVAAGVPA